MNNEFETAMRDLAKSIGLLVNASGDKEELRDDVILKAMSAVYVNHHQLERASKMNNEMLLNPDMPADELRLHMGELTANEVLVARSAIRLANTRATESEQLRKERDELAVRVSTLEAMIESRGYDLP